MTFKLFGYWRSSSAWRVRIALAYKGIEHEYQPVHLVRDGGEQHGEAYLAVNPMAEVPTLEITDSAGSVGRIGQSLAIIEFLDAVSPKMPLVPADPYLRARARQLAEIVNSGIQPLQNAKVPHLGPPLGAEGARRLRLRACRVIEVRQRPFAQAEREDWRPSGPRICVSSARRSTGRARGQPAGDRRRPRRPSPSRPCRGCHR